MRQLGVYEAWRPGFVFLLSLNISCLPQNIVVTVCSPVMLRALTIHPWKLPSGRTESHCLWSQPSINTWEESSGSPVVDTSCALTLLHRSWNDTPHLFMLVPSSLGCAWCWWVLVMMASHHLLQVGLIGEQMWVGTSVLCQTGTPACTRWKCALRLWYRWAWTNPEPSKLTTPVQSQHKPKQRCGSHRGTGWPKPLQVAQLSKRLLLNPNCEIGTWPYTKPMSWLNWRNNPHKVDTEKWVVCSLPTETFSKVSVKSPNFSKLGIK